MKKLLFLLITGLFMLSTAPVESYASHFAGSDLTYSCIGGNDYLVTYSFYRDCSGVSAPSAVTVQFACSSNPLFNFSVTLQPIAGTGQEVTPGCSAIPTHCSGGSGYGMQEYVYQGIVTLAPCNTWTMSYSLCCRNPSNTIQSPTSQSGFMKADLNNLAAPCNSSPYFTNKPITIMCSGQTMCYNHGAVDPDGDSLSFTLVNPMNSATGTVTYIGGYSAQQPVPSIPPVTIDPVTGTICMSPTMNIVSPMAVRVDEWREINGTPTLIGTVFRDMQVNVVSCNNALPTLSGMDTTLSSVYNPNDTTYYIEMCLGPTVNFTIKGYDADTFNQFNIGSPEKMTITWNQGIPAGTFTVFNNNSDSAYAQFTWTPTINDVSNTPKCFTATVHDEACPYYGLQAFSYCIVVRGMYVEIGNDTLLCHGESMTFNAVADTTTVNYIWKLNGNPTGTPQSSTTYTLNTSGLAPGTHIVGIETNDGSTTIACPGIDNVVVEVVYQPDVNLGNDTTFCDGSSLTLDAGPGSQYGWNTGAITQTIQVNQTGVYIASVDGGNGTRCTDSDTILVSVVPMPVVDLGPDTCSTTPVTVDAGNDPNTFQYTWSDGSTGQTININTSGTYTVTVTADPTSGCEKTDSKVVNVITEDLITASFEGTNLGPGDQTMCTHQNLTFAAPTAPTGHTYAYIWTLDGAAFGNGPSTALNGMTEGDYILQVDVGGGCVGDVTVTVEYCELIIPNIITPNGDGVNETFQIEGLEFYPGSQIIITNRWGKKVFESTNYTNDQAWDAENNSDGVYYYIFRIADGRDTERSGTLTVLRN